MWNLFTEILYRPGSLPSHIPIWMNSVWRKTMRVRLSSATKMQYIKSDLKRNVSGYVCNHGSPSGERDTASPRGRYGDALSVTRSEDTYEKTPPVGRRQPMTSLPAYHNISAAGRIHHQLLRLKLASEAWLKAQGTQCLVPHSGNPWLHT